MAFVKLVCSFLLAAPLICGAINPNQTRRGQEIIGPVPDYVCEENGVFPNMDDCSQFIQCWMDEAVMWQCTDLMLFDLTYYGCNFAHLTHCEDRPRPSELPTYRPTPSTPSTTEFTGPTTSTTEGPDPGDFVCPDDGVFAHEERCEYYWECWAGESVLYHCTLDHLFDRVYMGCNYPGQTDCDHRLRPNETTARPSTTTTSAPITTTGLPTTPRTTSSDDPETEQTIPSEGSTTLNPNPTTTTQPAPTTTPNPGEEFECPSGDDGDFPDPFDCSKFYTCVGGMPYHNDCPAGLYFNPLIDACDFPANVDCQDRPTMPMF